MKYVLEQRDAKELRKKWGRKALELVKAIPLKQWQALMDGQGIIKIELDVKKSLK